MIRVLHVVTCMNRGGIENALMNYYRHIDRSQLQFDFVVERPEKGDFEDEILALGGRVHRVPQRRLTNPMPYVHGLYRLLKVHPEYRIVHVHQNSYSIFPILVAYSLGLPVRIAHAHTSSDKGGLESLLQRSLRPWLYDVATHAFACGEGAAEYLYGPDALSREKVRIIRNCIEAPKFAYDAEVRRSYRERLGLSEDCLVLGCIGRLDAVKNHQLAIRILAELRGKGLQTKLLLVGDGSLRCELEAQVAELQLESEVVFCGKVGDVYNYQQAIDIYMMPSLYEGLPLSLVEAQVSGLPCLVTGYCPREADITGLCQFLELRVEPWVEAIIALHTAMPQRRSYLSEAIALGYDAETSANVLSEFYYSV